MKIDGRCHCGAIRFSGDVDPARAHICHCTDCQALTGTAWRVSVAVAADAITLTGEPKFYTKTNENGVRRLQAFCGDCGSPIYSTAPENRDVLNLRLGLIAQRAELPPRLQIFRRSALPWASNLTGLHAFDGMP